MEILTPHILSNPTSFIENFQTAISLENKRLSTSSGYSRQNYRNLMMKQMKSTETNNFSNDYAKDTYYSSK